MRKAAPSSGWTGLSKMKGLTESNKRGRRLAVAAGLSKAAWGPAAIGLSPTGISKLRAEMAAATDINKLGRCRTAAILIAHGHRQDPAVKLARGAALMWLDLWKESPGPTGDWPGGKRVSNSSWAAK